MSCLLNVNPAAFANAIALIPQFICFRTYATALDIGATTGGTKHWGNHGGIAPTKHWGNHGGIAPTKNTMIAQEGNKPMTNIDIQPTSPDYFIPNRFQGKTLLVTGAATGIGAATAIRAAREGANIVGVDRKEQELSLIHI